MGVLGGKLDWSLVGFGAGIGVIVILIDEAMGKAGRMRLPPLGFGMGIYLPMGLTLLIPIGALIGEFTTGGRIVSPIRNLPNAWVCWPQPDSSSGKVCLALSLLELSAPQATTLAQRRRQEFRRRGDDRRAGGVCRADCPAISLHKPGGGWPRRLTRSVAGTRPT